MDAAKELTMLLRPTVRHREGYHLQHKAIREIVNYPGQIGSEVK